MSSVLSSFEMRPLQNPFCFYRIDLCDLWYKKGDGMAAWNNRYHFLSVIFMIFLFQKQLRFSSQTENANEILTV